MREFYEELWERLPEDLHPPELELRKALLSAAVRPGDRVLDLGCGAGDFSFVAAGADAGSVTGADVAEAALRRARRTADALAGRGEPGQRAPVPDFRLVPFDGPLPFATESFDLIWASEVIEHVADTALWMREVRRVLAPGGRLLLTTPAHGRLRLLLGGIERYSPPQGDHLHLYSRRSLTQLLQEFGYASTSTEYLSGPPLMRRTLLARAQRSAAFMEVAPRADPGM